MDGAVEFCEMLSDIFRGRSFVTLKKRALAVLKICDYLEIERSIPMHKERVL